jgi:hypothetical protein
MPWLEPGPSSSASVGAASARRATAAEIATVLGRRMIQWASRAHMLCSSSARRSRTRFGTRRTRSSRSTMGSITGRRVRAQTTETTGIARPPTPNPRMNGSGIASSSASPIATAVPLKTTARPAVSIVRTTASERGSPGPPARRSSR